MTCASTKRSCTLVILTRYDRIATAFEAGQEAAHGFLVKTKDLSPDREAELEPRLVSMITHRPVSYDWDQKKLADGVAHEYRQIEDRAGTIAYWHFEEGRLAETVRAKLAGATAHIRILDIGAGDGRYEEALFSEFGNNVHVTALDFSGKMLDCCRQRRRDELAAGLLHLERCVAELLPFPDRAFDVIIAGFGFLSYCDTPRVLNEVRRVARDDADLLLSNYNYDALFYTVWENRLDDLEVPISGKIDRRAGTLDLGGGRPRLRVRPMSQDEMHRLLEHHGVTCHVCSTFPVLYATLPRRGTKRTPDETVDKERYHGLADFSPRIYDQDVVISDALADRGYYALHRCRIVPR